MRSREGLNSSEVAGTSGGPPSSRPLASSARSVPSLRSARMFGTGGLFHQGPPALQLPTSEQTPAASPAVEPSPLESVASVQDWANPALAPVTPHTRRQDHSTEGFSQSPDRKFSFSRVSLGRTAERRGRLPLVTPLPLGRIATALENPVMPMPMAPSPTSQPPSDDESDEDEAEDLCEKAMTVAQKISNMIAALPPLSAATAQAPAAQPLWTPTHDLVAASPTPLRTVTVAADEQSVVRAAAVILTPRQRAEPEGPPKPNREQMLEAELGDLRLRVTRLEQLLSDRQETERRPIRSYAESPLTDTRQEFKEVKQQLSGVESKVTGLGADMREVRGQLWDVVRLLTSQHLGAPEAQPPLSARPLPPPPTRPPPLARKAIESP